MKASSVNSTIS